MSIAVAITSAANLSGIPLRADEQTGVAADATASPEPLYQRIDRAVEQVAIGPLASVCGDTDFLRRIYLDLTGVIPDVDQAKAFLADPSPTKRTDLVETLINSPAFSRHMALQFNVVMLDRRTDKYVDQKVWETYLIDSIEHRKPLDQIFSELIAPDRKTPEVTAARKFLLNRDAQPHAMTREIGRLMFGMDLQCAQCHDHPVIADYHQEDYFGLYAFLLRTSLQGDAGNQTGDLSERADGETPFESVFTGQGRAAALPRVPRGAAVYVEPKHAEDQAYRVKPENNQAARPTYSRRETLADMLADSNQFRRNVANRIWALVMGRGLVHPLDFHYAANPPSNPALLALLADDLVSSGFDLRYMIRQLVLSKTYQRGCEPPRPDTINVADIQSRQESLTRYKESLAPDAEKLKLAAAATESGWRSAVDANDAVASELPALETALTAAQKVSTDAQAEELAAADVVASLETRLQGIEAVVAATRAASERFADETKLAESLAILQPRTAELTVSLNETRVVLAAKQASTVAARQAVAGTESEVAKVLERQINADRLVELERAHLPAQSVWGDADAAVRLTDAQIRLCQGIIDYQKAVIDSPEKAATAWESIVDQWTSLGQVAALKPLMPEQLAASTMQATGYLLSRVQTTAQGEIDKTPPPQLAEEGISEDEKNLRRGVALQAEVINQLRGAIDQFVIQYGGLAGEEFQATVNQALFMGNSPMVNGWLTASGDNLVARLVPVETPQGIADEISLAIFSRPSTSQEQQEIAEYLATDPDAVAGDRPAAMAEMVWAFLSSAEFRFNH